MEKKKPKASSTTTASTDHEDDNTAVVKAAAWAWLQRGSGSDGKPMIREFDATTTTTTTTRRAPIVSRFKLEAMMIANKPPFNELEYSPISLITSPTKSDITTNSSSVLLDPYEIQSISKRLECLIDESSSGGDYRDQVKGVPRDQEKKKKKKKKKLENRRKKTTNLMNLLWFRHGAMCGARGDHVVEPKVLDRLRPVVPVRGSVSSRSR